MWKEREARIQTVIETWKYMKDEFMDKYVPPLYFANLIDKWHRITQDNRSAKEYVTEFDEVSHSL